MRRFAVRPLVTVSGQTKRVKRMKIGVVGSGIAGSCAAWLLRKQGHQVHLFEQAAEFRPVGAGILLQPSGQRALQLLGLPVEAECKAARIQALHATHRSGRTLVRLDYRRVHPHLFGLGIRRSELFNALLQRCRQAGVQLHAGCRIEGYTRVQEGIRLVQAASQADFTFDCVVAADGSGSALRHRSNLRPTVHHYADAAFWTVGPWDGATDVLHQLVDRSGRLVGILPLGAGKCSFFWGLKRSTVDEVQAQGIDRWKQQVVDLWPLAESIVHPIRDFSELTFAGYRHVRLRPPSEERIVFIGDAAHATSPHLGQGTGLALEDAVTLSQALQTHGKDVDAAFAQYRQKRQSKVRFYSQLTATLTPFFQTSSRLLQTGRNLALPLMSRLPFIGSQMVLTMAGLKRGWLTQERFQ